MRRTVLIAALVLAATLSSFAQGFWHECSPAGTWYGGSEAPAKYLLTVMPTPQPGHYMITYDEGFTPPVPRLSQYSGELIRVGYNKYEGRMIALANTSAATPQNGGINSQIWAGHETGRLSRDCNTMNFEIDFFGVYEWGTVPFEKPPLYSRIPAGVTVIKETYTRMAKSCPVCQTVPEEAVTEDAEPEEE